MSNVPVVQLVVRRVLVLFVALAVAVPTLGPAPSAEATGNLVPDPGFEAGPWTENRDPDFPATSIWRGNWNIGKPKTGSRSTALSSLAHGDVRSARFGVTEGASYDFHAWLRGHMDPGSNSVWQLRARWFDDANVYIGQVSPVWGGPASLSTSWMQRGGTVTAPVGAKKVELMLRFNFGSGWVAYDDVTFVEVGGDGTNLVASPGFEESTGWTAHSSWALPGTSVRRGTDGSAAPRSGSYAWVLSSHAQGTLDSDLFTVIPGAQYDVGAWVRGELEQGTVRGWAVRASWYDESSVLLAEEEAASGGAGSISAAAWTDARAQVTAPAGAVQARLSVAATQLSGWVAFDAAHFHPVGDPAGNLLVNPSFDDGPDGWTAAPHADFPGTAIVRGMSDITAPYGGTHAWAIGNLATGHVRSAAFTVAAGAQYQAEAWVRGELDPSSDGGWTMNVHWYDENGQPIEADNAVASGDRTTLPTAYQLFGGPITAPSGAETASFEFAVRHINGWVAVDDANVVETAPPPPPPPPEVVATPSPLNATIVEGSGVIGTIELTSSTGAPLDFYLFDDSDIIAGYYPSSGETPATVTVYTHSFLERGFHTGYITGSVNVDVNLTITGPVPSLGAAPSPLAFTSTGVGLTNDRTLALSSLGSGDDGHIVVESVAITGADAAEFSHAFSGPATLTPGSSTDFTVTFAPQSAGPKSAQLEVTHNGPNTPLVVLLDAPQPATLGDTTVLLDPAAITTAAGDGTAVSANGVGTSASFAAVRDVAYADDVVYVAEASALRTYDPGTGQVDTLAGDASVAGCMDSADPAGARFDDVTAMAATGDAVYVVDGCSATGSAVRQVALPGGETSTLSEPGWQLHDIVVGPSGDLYATTADLDVLRIDAASGAATVHVTYPASDPTLGATHGLHAISVDSSNLWIAADSDPDRVDRVALGSAAITPLVADDRVGLAAVAVAGDYVYGAGVGPAGGTALVRRYDRATGDATVVGGSGAAGYADGVETEAWFDDVAGLAVDGQRLWVADAGNLRLRLATDGPPIGRSRSAALDDEIEAPPAEFAILAGSGASATVNGDAASASFSPIQDVVVSDGAAYVAEYQALRRVDLITGQVTTTAGDPSSSGCGDTTVAGEATLSTEAATTDGAYVYVLDTCPAAPGKSVRRVSLATGAVSTVTVVDSSSNDLTFGPDGYLYVVGSEPDVLRVDPVDGTAATVYDSASGYLGITATSNALWLARYSKVARLDLVTLQLTDVADLPEGSQIAGIEAVGSDIFMSFEFSAPAATGPQEGLQAGTAAAAGLEQSQSSPSGGGSLWRLDTASGEWKFVGSAGGTGMASDGVQVYLGWPNVLGVMLSDELLSAGGYDAYGAWRAGVNAVAQNFVTTHGDASIATAGPALAVSRTYNSRDRRNGPFGIGWSFDYAVTAEKFETAGVLEGISITYPDGRREYHRRLADGTFEAPSGRYSVLTGDPLAAPGFTVTRKDRMAYQFDQFGFDPATGTFGNGLLRSISDANGRSLSLTYDASDQLDMVADGHGRYLDFSWAAGHVTEVATNPVGGAPLVWKYYYDGDRLVDACDPRDNAQTGSCTRYAYVLDRMTEIRRSEGNVEAALGYNADGSVQWRQDGLGHVTSFAYPEAGRVEVTDPRGYTTVYEYAVDELRLVRETDPEGGVVQYGYDASGNRDRITDANGNLVTMAYDARGNVTSITDGEGETTHYEFDGADNLTVVRDPRSGAPGSGGWDSFTTTYGYDAAGNRTSETDALGNTSSAAYTDGTEAALDGGTVPAGLLKSHVSARGTVSADPAPYTTTYDYFSNGDLGKVTERSGLVTEYQYDEIGRLRFETVIYGDPPNVTSAVTETAYDEVGNAVVVVQPATQNVVTLEQQQLRITTTYDRNDRAVQRLEENIAGSGGTRLTVMEFDANDREWKVTDPEGGVLERHFDEAGNVRRVVDQESRVVETQFDGRNLPTLVVAKAFVDDPVAGSPERDITLRSVTYDAAGRVLTETDAEGRVRRWVYDRADRVKTVTLEGFQDLEGPRDIVLEEYDYDPAGRVLREITGGLRTVDHTYDEAGRLETTTVDPGGLGRVTTMGYDAAGNIETRTLTDGTRTETTTYGYDPADRLISQKVENGNDDLVTEYGYDRRDNLVSLTDPRGAAHTREHDELGRLVRETAPEVTVTEAGVGSPGSPVAETGYDAWGNVTHARDARGFVTVSEYDGLDRRTHVHHPAYTDHTGSVLNPVEVFEYDRVGNLTQRTSRRGAVTDFDYDDFNRLVRQRDPVVDGERGVTRHTYDDVGNRASTVDQRGARLEWSYDELDRVRTTTQFVDQSPDPDLELVTTTHYDDLGNVDLATYPDQTTTSASYNAASEPVTATDQLGHVTSFEHDVAGRRTLMTEPGGRAVGWDYDLAGRLTHEHLLRDGTILSTTVYGYDGNGNRTSATTPRGFTTTFDYDALDRLIEVVVPVDVDATPEVEIATTYGYDAVGNRTQVTDGRGNDWAADYQAWNLVEQYTEPDVAPAQDGVFTSWYDAGGLAVRDEQPGGVTIDRVFDALGRLQSETGSGGVGASRIFGYDLGGLRTSVSHPAGNLTFEYDDRGLMTEATPAGASEPASSFTYDEMGRLESRDDEAGLTLFTWTPRGRLDTALDPLTGTTVDYSWDASGRLESVDYGPAARTVTFDDFGRLDTDTLRDASSTVVAGLDYGYDPDGNVATVDVTLPGNPEAGLHSYAYDDGGRLIEWTSPVSGAVAFGWDPSGNRTAVGGDSYQYDARNRLTGGPQGDYAYSARGTLASITAGPDLTTFTFDALGRLVDYDGQVSYGYDGLDRVARRNSVNFEYSGFALDATVDDRFTYSRLPGGRVLAQQSGATGAALAGLSRHGDLTYLFDATGSVSDTFVYDPFGAVAASTGTTVPAIGFQGDYTDAASGHVWMGARWYSAADAAFRSRDSVFGELATPVSLNRYTYAWANPLSYWDPDGRLSRPMVDGMCTRAISCIVKGAQLHQPTEFNNTRRAVAAARRQVIERAFEQARASVEANAERPLKAGEALNEVTRLLFSGGDMRDGWVDELRHESMLAIESSRYHGTCDWCVFGIAAAGSVFLAPVAPIAAIGSDPGAFISGMAELWREEGFVGTVKALTVDAVAGCVSGMSADDPAVAGASFGCVVDMGLGATGAVRGGFRAITHQADEFAGMATLRQSPPSLDAPPAIATAADEPAAALISRTAQRQSDRGVEGLLDFLTDAEAAAFAADPAGGSRFLGQAVHRATDVALREAFFDRFLYRTRGIDFVDRVTGEMIELTTPGQVPPHMARPGYEGASYATYDLPRVGPP